MLGHNGTILRHNTKWLGAVIPQLPNNSFFSLNIRPQFVSIPKSMYVKVTPAVSSTVKYYRPGWEGEQADGTVVTYYVPYWIEQSDDNSYPPLYYFNTVTSDDYEALATTGITLTAREGYYVKEFNIAFWNGVSGQYEIPRTINAEVQLYGCDTSIHSSNPFIRFSPGISGGTLDGSVIEIPHVENPPLVTYEISRY